MSLHVTLSAQKHLHVGNENTTPLNDHKNEVSHSVTAKLLL